MWFCYKNNEKRICMMMKTVAFMPIKLNNERVPGKNLKPMDDGKILISFMLETLFQVKKDGIVDDIVVFAVVKKSRSIYPIMLIG